MNILKRTVLIQENFSLCRTFFFFLVLRLNLNKLSKPITYSLPVVWHTPCLMTDIMAILLEPCINNSTAASIAFSHKNEPDRTDTGFNAFLTDQNEVSPQKHNSGETLCKQTADSNKSNKQKTASPSESTVLLQKEKQLTQNKKVISESSHDATYTNQPELNEVDNIPDTKKIGHYPDDVNIPSFLYFPSVFPKQTANQGNEVLQPEFIKGQTSTKNTFLEFFSTVQQTVFQQPAVSENEPFVLSAKQREGLAIISSFVSKSELKNLSLEMEPLTPEPVPDSTAKMAIPVSSMSLPKAEPVPDSTTKMPIPGSSMPPSKAEPVPDSTAKTAILVSSMSLPRTKPISDNITKTTIPASSLPKSTFPAEKVFSPLFPEQAEILEELLPDRKTAVFFEQSNNPFPSTAPQDSNQDSFVIAPLKSSLSESENQNAASQGNREPILMHQSVKADQKNLSTIRKPEFNHAVESARALQESDPADMKARFSSQGNRLAVSVEPEGLGKLNINLSLDRGTLNAQIQVADPITRNLLENNMQQIVTTLSNEGLDVGGFSVSLRHADSGETEEQTQDQAHKSVKQDLSGTTAVDVSGTSIINLFV